ncbi:MAG: hypothetical protein VZR27_04085 [Acutalibacteraceae bacterium]|nr:hypothetical protein [Acutalibacteraceae bacterium]
MKISKAVLASMIAFSILGLTACDSNNNVTSDQTNGGQSSVASSSNANADASDEKTDNSSEAADTKSASGENKDDNKSDNTENTGKANAYGFYEETNTPSAGVSVAGLAGSWHDMGIGTEILTVTAEDDLYKGTFLFRNDEGKVTTGYIRLEYSLTSDNEKEYWYTFYQDDGTLWNAFSVDGSIPLTDIYAGQSGDPHFRRIEVDEEGTDSNKKNVTEISEYVGTYSEGKGVLTFDVDSSLNCYFKVTWPLGDAETREWTFSANFDDVDSFYYDDCTKTITTYDENGEQTTETDYLNGSGHVTVSQNEDGNYIFIWYDNQEHIADGSVFIKSE